MLSSVEVETSVAFFLSGVGAGFIVGCCFYFITVVISGVGALDLLGKD